MTLDINELLEEALTNVRSDRLMTKKLAEDVAEFIGTITERHATVGIVAAKYLETLQRSNEQIIKIATLVKTQKKQDNEVEKLGQSEKNDIYEEFEGKKDGT